MTEPTRSKNRRPLADQQNNTDTRIGYVRPHEHAETVSELINKPIGYRLTAGFSLMNQSER